MSKYLKIKLKKNKLKMMVAQNYFMKNLICYNENEAENNLNSLKLFLYTRYALNYKYIIIIHCLMSLKCCNLFEIYKHSYVPI